MPPVAEPSLLAHPVVRGALWDAAALLVVFAASCARRAPARTPPTATTRLATAYWTLHAPLLALYWAFGHVAGAAADVHRVGAVLALLAVWAAQLVYTRHSAPPPPPTTRPRASASTSTVYAAAVSLVAFHAAPAALLFAAMLPAYFAVAGVPAHAFGAVDMVAYALGIAGVCLESVAGMQLRAFMTERRQGVLSSGVWAWSRHPNYVGEMSLWWGVWLFGAAAAPQHIWWTVFGPLATTLMYLGYSIPHDEARMEALHPEAWARVKARVSRCLPWPPRGDEAVQAELCARAKKDAAAATGKKKGKGKGAGGKAAVRSPGKAAARRNGRAQ